MIRMTIEIDLAPTGQGNEFGTAKKTRARHEPIIGKAFYYNFGDGWGASVSVREVDSKEARKLRKESAGFCGYDWMVDEIRYHGRILSLSERDKRVAA